MTASDLSRDEFELWRQSRCIVCGEQYQPATCDRVFCGSTCRQRKHRERFREHVTTWNRQHAPRAATCADCGIEFVAGSRGMLPKRCPDCKKAARRMS